MIKWKLDNEGKEYTTAKGAAAYLGMPRTTFIYYTGENYPAAYRVPNKIILFKKVFYKEDLNKWSAQTKNIQFRYKQKPEKTDPKVSNVTKLSEVSKKSKKSS